MDKNHKLALYPYMAPVIDDLVRERIPMRAAFGVHEEMPRQSVRKKMPRPTSCPSRYAFPHLR